MLHCISSTLPALAARQPVVHSYRDNIEGGLVTEGPDLLVGNFLRGTALLSRADEVIE